MVNAVPVAVQPEGMPCSKSARTRSVEGGGVTAPETVIAWFCTICDPSAFHESGYVTFVPAALFDETNGFDQRSPENPLPLCTMLVHH
ncbi:hypothetical protein, partial [Mycobacteroides abscessus]|uniref:hypothetical protein n=1 Tax=Mycobacteroides abscessus TaxID=36809 RepID=UPI00104231FD